MQRGSAARGIAWACGTALVASAACGDPARDEAIAALGPETAFVAPGPTHRPGQPCLLCHADGSLATAFSVGGTIFVDGMSTTPAPNVNVYIIDSANNVYKTTTNCAGNFYILPSQFAPTYPFWVTLKGGDVRRDMDSPVYRDGSCAGCHVGSPGPTTPGHVYLIDDPTTQMAPTSNCQ
jgi:hypothetical protein